MGVDITQYRSRIGLFLPHRCKQPRKITKFASRNGGCKCCVAMATYNLLPLFVIGILLLISGVEVNPGPGNKQTDTDTEIKDCKINRGEWFNRLHHFPSQHLIRDRQTVSDDSTMEHEDNMETTPSSSNNSEDCSVALNKSYDDQHGSSNPTLDTGSNGSDNGHEECNPTLSAGSAETEVGLEQLEENVQSSLRDFLSLPEEQSLDLVPKSSDNRDKVVMIQNRNENTLNLTMNFTETKGPIQLGKSNQVYDVKQGEKEDVRSVTCILQHLIDRTKEEIDHQKISWVDRTGFDELIRRLRASKMVVLTGICGEGKTRIAMHLMKLTLKGSLPGFTNRIPIKINDPCELTHVVRSGKDILLFIDDIFGSTNLNETLLRQWEQKLNDIGRDVSRGQIMLIVSSRKHIFTEALTLLKHSAYSAITTNLFSERRHIDLSGRYTLSLKEKRLFVEKAIEQQTGYDLKICGHQKEENISQCQNTENKTVYIAEQTIDNIIHAETSLGFPYLCNLFISSKDIISKGLSFFTKSNYYLEKEINAMFHCDKVKYFTLVYTLLNNDKSTLYVDSKKLDPFKISKSDQDTLQKIAQACGLTGATPQSIKDAAECLKGVFFKYNSSSNSYTFPHQSILETVSLHFGRKYPDMLLQHCSFKFLEQFVSLEKPDLTRDKPEIFVSSEYFETLSGVMYGYLLKSLLPESQINNRIMKDENFVFYFFNYLDRNQLTQNLLEKRYSCYGRCSCKNIKHIYQHSVAAYASGNELFLKKLIDRGILDTSQLQSNQYQIAECSGEKFNYCDCYMLNAFKHGNTVCIKLLLHYGISLPEQSLCLAASGNGELLKFIFQQKKWSQREVNMALHRSCAMGTIQNVKYLADQEVYLDGNSFHLAVDSGDVETVNFVLHQARPSDFDKILALYKACKDRNFQVLKFLAEKGVYFGLSLLELAARYSGGKTDILHYIYVSKKWTLKQKTKALNHSCKFGSTSALSYLLEMGSVCDDDTLCIATKSGYISIVKTVFPKYDWPIKSLKDSINAACKKGYLDIIQYFISNNVLFNDESLNFVVHSGNEDLLHYVLNKQEEWAQEQIDDAMREACKRCSLPMVKYLNDFGANCTETIFPFISTNTNLFKFVLNNGNWSMVQLEKSLKEACRNSDIEIIKYLNIETGLPYSDECLKLATESGNASKLKYVYESGNWSNLRITESFDIACKKGLMDMITYFHQKGGACSLEGLKGAVCSMDISVVQFLITEFEWTNDEKTEAMNTACGTGDLEIVRYLHSKDINYGNNALSYAVVAREDFVQYIYSTGTWTVAQINKAIEEAERRANNSSVNYLREKLFARI